MKSIRFSSLLLICCCSCLISLQGQSYVPVFPDLTGDQLLDSVVWKYKPVTTLSYAACRDTMYGRIYNVNDSVSCVYTGHRLYLPPGEDPTTAMYLNGSPNGITNEHTWPQSFGADFGNPQSDMHHLFPSRAIVNDARGNLPFAEIPDNETDTWYYLDQSQSNIPSAALIDLYSEKADDFFEPKEAHKGNVARAMFYFYTMYRAEANNANPDFFWDQRTTLCQWHYLDPVDQPEYDRTWMIAQYQNGKPNPYVIDCSLVARAWCEDTPGDCAELPLSTTIEDNVTNAALFPNPCHNNFTLQLSLAEKADLEIRIYDPSSRLVSLLPVRPVLDGNHQFALELPHAGVFIVVVNLNGEHNIFLKVVSL